MGYRKWPSQDLRMMSPVPKSPCQHRKCSGRQIKMITFCVTEGASSESTSSCFSRETFVTSGTLMVAKSRQPGPGGCRQEGLQREGGVVLSSIQAASALPGDDRPCYVSPALGGHSTSHCAWGPCGWGLPFMSTCHVKSNSNHCLSLPLLKPQNSTAISLYTRGNPRRGKINRPRFNSYRKEESRIQRGTIWPKFAVFTLHARGQQTAAWWPNQPPASYFRGPWAKDGFYIFKRLGRKNLKRRRIFCGTWSSH